VLFDVEFEVEFDVTLVPAACPDGPGCCPVALALFLNGPTPFNPETRESWSCETLVFSNGSNVTVNL